MIRLRFLDEIYFVHKNRYKDNDVTSAQSLLHLRLRVKPLQKGLLLVVQSKGDNQISLTRKKLLR